MKDKKWAIWCVFVGIFGGLFLTVVPLGILAAGIAADGSVVGTLMFLVMFTYVTIFFVAFKSRRYYIEDTRVYKWAANLFLFAGTIGCTPIFIGVLGSIPFVNQVLYWLFKSAFSGAEAFSIIFVVVELVAFLSIISGIGYGFSLKNFKEDEEE